MTGAASERLDGEVRSRLSVPHAQVIRVKDLFGSAIVETRDPLHANASADPWAGKGTG